VNAVSVLSVVTDIWNKMLLTSYAIDYEDGSEDGRLLANSSYLPGPGTTSSRSVSAYHKRFLYVCTLAPTIELTGL
jgi:hypothetical protein